MSEPEMIIDSNDPTFKFLNGDYSGLNYYRCHHPSYYADDPRDMDILEEVKEEE